MAEKSRPLLLKKVQHSRSFDSNHKVPANFLFGVTDDVAGLYVKSHVIT